MRIEDRGSRIGRVSGVPILSSMSRQQSSYHPCSPLTIRPDHCVVSFPRFGSRPNGAQRGTAGPTHSPSFGRHSPHVAVHVHTVSCPSFLLTFGTSMLTRRWRTHRAHSPHPHPDPRRSPTVSPMMPSPSPAPVTPRYAVVKGRQPTARFALATTVVQRGDNKYTSGKRRAKTTTPCGLRARRAGGGYIRPTRESRVRRVAHGIVDAWMHVA